MQAYCPRCGLWMTNGFCLHGSAAEAIARKQQRQALDQKLLAQTGQTPPPRR